MARKTHIDITISPEVNAILEENAPPRHAGGKSGFIEGAIIERALASGDLRALDLKERHLTARKEALAAEMKAARAQVDILEAELSEIRAFKNSAIKRQERRAGFIEEVRALVDSFSIYPDPSGHGTIEGPEGMTARQRSYRTYSIPEAMESTTAAFMVRNSAQIAALINRARRALVVISREEIAAIFEDTKRPDMALKINELNQRELERLQFRIERFKAQTEGKA